MTSNLIDYNFENKINNCSEQIEIESSVQKTLFYNWLYQFYKYDKNNIKHKITHTSIGEPTGCFYIPDEDLNIFYNKYFETLNKLENTSSKLHLIEVHNDISPILIDLDIHIPLDYSRTYDFNFIKNIISLYNEIIKRNIEVNDDDLKAYVFEKSHPVENKTKTKLKDGIHIVYPYIITKPNIQYFIRECILSNKDKLNKIFENTNVKNEYSDIFDKAVICETGWQMYGSCKPKSLTYKLKHIVNSNLEEEEINYDINLIELLSIRNKTNENNTIFNEKLNNYLKKNENTKKKTKKKKIHSCITDYTILGEPGKYEHLNKIIIPCIDLLSNNPDIINKYDEWIQFGWILHNIHNIKDNNSCEKDPILLNKWIELSKKSEKYIDGDCENRWNQMEDRGLGPGTLFMLSKLFNHEEYSNITRKGIIEEVFNALFKKKVYADYYIAELISAVINGINKDCIDELNIVYTKYQSKEKWFEYREDLHKWVIDEGSDGICLRQKLPTIICNLIEEKINEMEESRKTNDDDMIKEILEKRVKLLEQYKSKLLNSSPQDSIVKMVKTHYLIVKNDIFLKKLDTNPFLIHFNNGVYDLNELQFRKGRRDDLLTYSTNIKYTKYEDDSYEIKLIEKFIFSILPEKDVRDYTLTILSSCLSGDTSNEKFHVFIGGGGNGKSKLLDLVKAILGDYYWLMNVQALTGKRNNSANADPELSLTEGKRMILFQENETGEVINTSKMKEWTGGDEIVARALYENSKVIKPQFKCFMTSNNIPSFSSNDDGVWRRARMIHFKTKFVDPKNFDEDKVYEKGKIKDIYHCLKDSNLINDVMQPNVIEAFAYYLINNYYNKYHELMKKYSNIPEPKAVTEYTDIIKSENNIVRQYFNERISFSLNNKPTIKFKDLWDNFLSYLDEFGEKNSYKSKAKTIRPEMQKIYEELIYTKLNKKEKIQTKLKPLLYINFINIDENEDNEDDNY